MKRILVSLIGAISALLPLSLSANAQSFEPSFEPFPNDIGCVVVNSICRTTSENGYPFLVAIPTGYQYQYLISVEKQGDNNLVVIFDLHVDQIAAYILVDNTGALVDRLDNGSPGYGGKLELLEENSIEIVALLVEIELY
jgi:hypothetical protein